MQAEPVRERTNFYALDVFVPGIPRPGGSKKAWVYTPKGGGKPRAAMQDASGVNGKNWRASIVGVVAEHWKSAPLDCPLRVDFDFVMPRPQSHFDSKGALKANAPRHHLHDPDKTKLTRAAEDALNAIVWKDDNRIVSGEQTKSYGERPGVRIRVQTL